MTTNPELDFSATAAPEPGSAQELSETVESILYDAAHDESIDREAAEFVSERRGSARRAWHQFRSLGLPRCYCGQLILPWQSWVCDYEEWPKHHACWHSGLIEGQLDETDEDLAQLRYNRRCRFCGWLTPRWAAVLATGSLASGDPAARDLAQLIIRKLTAQDGAIWFSDSEERLGGLSPKATIRSGRISAVKSLLDSFEPGEIEHIWARRRG
jgi:hypothetical protein